MPHAGKASCRLRLSMQWCLCSGSGVWPNSAAVMVICLKHNEARITTAREQRACSLSLSTANQQLAARVIRDRKVQQNPALEINQWGNRDNKRLYPNGMQKAVWPRVLPDMLKRGIPAQWSKIWLLKTNRPGCKMQIDECCGGDAGGGAVKKERERHWSIGGHPQMKYT